jgi:hypothetical protein
MPPGLVRLPPTRTRRGCRGRGLSDDGALPVGGAGEKPCPQRVMPPKAQARGGKLLLGGSRQCNNAWTRSKTAFLLSQTERRDAESKKLIGIVHRYTLINPFNIFEKDTRMTCLLLLVWRSNIYGYRAGPFTTYLWKDRH